MGPTGVVALLRRIAARLRRNRSAADLRDELALHTDLLERDLRASGMSAPDARDAAHRQLGNRTRIAEESWEIWSLGSLDLLLLEVRFALRRIRRSPGFAATVVVTLALGIGVTATTFSIVDHVLLRPLPYAHANQLVALYERGANGDERLVSYPTLQDWAQAKTGFAGMAWIRGHLLTLDGSDGPELVPAGYVSAGFFRLMGEAPLIGRTFTPEEEAGGTRAVVLSHDLWTRTLGSDRGIIGHVVKVDSGSAIVIGVMPAGFAYPSWAQLWLPLGRLAGRDPMLVRRDFHADSRAIGRLAPGVSLTRAGHLLSLVQERIASDHRDAEQGWTGAALVPLRDEVVGDVQGAVWALGAAVTLVLLIACLNVANLAAARGAVRRRELAIRLALGASRVHVVGELTLESLILTAVGGTLGILGAYRTIAWVRATAPFSLPRAAELRVDGPAIVVAAGLSILTALIFSALPAIRAAIGHGAGRELLGGRTGAGGTRREVRSRAILTSTQFAIAVLLLVGAGLLVQSYRRLAAVQLGFDPHALFALTLGPPRPRYAEPQAALDLYERLVDRLRTVPGVEEAAVVNFLPLGQAGVPTRVEVPGRTSSSEDVATYLTASDGYLKTMGIPLIRGRWFSPQDMQTPGDGVVISQSVAKRYWPDEDPVGKPLTIYRSSQGRADFGQAVPSVVMGVVGDVRQFGPETELDPAVYVPISAEPWPWGTLVVRARSATAVSPAELRRAVLEVAPSLTPSRPGAALTFESVVQEFSATLAPRRYLLDLVGAFSVFALLLAAIGIYGVVSYTVAQRTHELGVRAALGATGRQILIAVMGQGVALAAAGCAVGIGSALVAARVARHLLYDTSPADLTVFVAVPLILLGVGVAAVYLPARRAGRIDPLIALRAE